jgi:hypothetical protein
MGGEELMQLYIGEKLGSAAEIGLRLLQQPCAAANSSLLLSAYSCSIISTCGKGPCSWFTGCPGCKEFNGLHHPWWHQQVRGFRQEQHTGEPAIA